MLKHTTCSYIIIFPCIGFKQSQIQIQIRYRSLFGALNIQMYCYTPNNEGRKEMFYLTMHSTHFIYGYMASDIWLKTILIVRKATRSRHIGYSFRLTAQVLLYAPFHRQDSTYHSLCYTIRGALAGTRNSSMGPPHEGSIRRPIASWANALTTELHLAPECDWRMLKHTTCSYIIIFACIRFKPSQIQIHLRYRLLFGALNIQVYRYTPNKHL